MKKLLVFILILLLLMGSVACSKNTDTIAETPDVSTDISQPEDTDAASDTDNSDTDTIDIVDRPYDIVFDETFQIFDPYAEALSDDLLISIGANGFTGSDAEIAQQIYDWQKTNMHYENDDNVISGVSFPGRWNMYLPGIFPASELLQERVLDNGNIYGLCWDYAIIYCSIANSYDLDVRASYFTKYTFSEANSWVDPETTRGLSVSEYNELNKKLTANGASFTYDQIDRVAREGFVHARAEVNINGEWVPYDAVPDVTGDYLLSENYEALPWYYAYNNVLLYAPPSMENNILNIDNLANLLSYVPQIKYDGITDDAGNEHRASSFQNLARGLGLVPYFTDDKKAADFLNVSIDDLEDSPEIAVDYEKATGKKFYIIADFLVYSEEEMEAESYVDLYNALTGSDMTIEEFNEYVK